MAKVAKTRQFSLEAIKNRIKKMLDIRARFLKIVDTLHVKLQPGNAKTGSNCWTVSLMPIADCGHNCEHCARNCYDIRNDCWKPAVQNDRAKNSAIHKADIARYWAEISLQIKANYVNYLRINVGGDMSDEDFAYLAEAARENPRTGFLFFTKNYEGINAFLDENQFPENVHPIMSAWPGLKLINPHNLPVSHVLWEDGTTTAPQFGAYYCGGNCTECAFDGKGCWTLKKGEHVIFLAH